MMEKIKAIIVDDEERAQDVLTSLVNTFCPQVELLGTYGTVKDAVKGIHAHHPALVFLDIEMPNYAGYELLNFFETIDFEIVFITAYDSYAIKAFEVSAVDYLLKPLDIDRLKEAVTKVQQRVATKSAMKDFEVLKASLTSDQVTKLVVTDRGDRIVLDVADIIAIEAQESYSKLYANGNTHIASKNLKHFEGLLEENNDFFRSHKSWIVNLAKLERFNRATGDIFLDADITAKLSKYRKAEFLSAAGLPNASRCN